MTRPTIMTALLLSLLIGLVPTGCGPAPETPKTSSEERITVVATTGMIADMVRSIGGDSVAVTTLVGEGVDPHLYQPTRDDVATLLDSDLIFYNGLFLEGRMGDVLDQAGKDRPVVAVAEVIDTTQLIHPEEEEHVDPHVWLSPDRWASCGEAVRATLAGHAPEQAETFQSNFEAWTARTGELTELGVRSIGSIPPDARVLVTSHDAFNYFGQAFDIEVVAVQGISTESEAGLADIEALVDLIVERKVPAVFVESSVPRRSIEALVEGAAARGHDVVIGGELYSDSMGPAGTPEGTWEGMVRHDIVTVTKALGGTVTVTEPVQEDQPS